MAKGRYRTDGTTPFDVRMEWPPHPRRLLMAETVFDANVPVHLAKANRVQLLRAAFGGRAHIPWRVRGEIMGLAEDDPSIRALYVPDWFADIHKLDRTGAQRAYDRQVAWKGRTVVEPNVQIGRGEAECHELAFQNAGWVVVSQDADAISHGRRGRRPVPVFALPDVLIVIAAKGLCRPDSAWSIYEKIVEADGNARSRYWDVDQATKDMFVGLADDLK